MPRDRYVCRHKAMYKNNALVIFQPACQQTPTPIELQHAYSIIHFLRGRCPFTKTFKNAADILLNKVWHHVENTYHIEKKPSSVLQSGHHIGL